MADLERKVEALERKVTQLDAMNPPYDPNFGSFKRCRHCGGWVHPQAECSCPKSQKAMDDFYKESAEEFARKSAGEYYNLTQKGVDFFGALENWCIEQGIEKEKIPQFLTGIVRAHDLDGIREKISWVQAYKELKAKGYLVVRDKYRKDKEKKR